MADPTPTGIRWTVTNLGLHIRGLINSDADAAGGSVPDRISNAIIACGQRLWNNYDWRFRRKQGTLTITAAEASEAAPSDFAELDQNWLKDYSETSTGLRFVQDQAEYQRRADMLESTDTGTPDTATIAWDQTSAAWKFYWTPTSDGSYTYSYWYLTIDPWTTGAVTANTVVPAFPPSFHEGWRLLSEAVCLGMYRQEADAERKMAEFKEWLSLQLAENDETISTPERIQQGYNDLPQLYSQGTGIDSAGSAINEWP